MEAEHEEELTERASAATNDISTVVEDPRDDYSSSYAPAAEDTLKYKYHWRRGLIKRRVVSDRKWSEVIKRILSTYSSNSLPVLRGC